MTSLKKLYKKLEEYRKDFDNEDNIDKFVETVDQIVACKDPSCFPILLNYFDDEDYTDFVFENLKSTLEEFDDDTYVKELLCNIHIMFPHAKEWAAGMLYAILNHSICNKLMDRYIYLANKNALSNILNFMLQEDPEHHQGRIDELLNKLKSTQEYP